MRILTATVIIVLLLVSQVSAIQRVVDNWDYGIKSGIAISDFYNCDDCIKDSKMGFTGGIFAEYQASDYFSIQPELLVVMKGWETSGNNINLNYLELPILFKVKIPTSGNVTPNFYVGPAGALMVSAKAEGYDVSELFQEIDYGIAIGAGADLEAGSGKVVFDVRYTLGLKAIPDNEILWGFPDDVPDIKNRALSFSVGFGW